MQKKHNEVAISTWRGLQRTLTAHEDTELYKTKVPFWLMSLWKLQRVARIPWIGVQNLRDSDGGKLIHLDPSQGVRRRQQPPNRKRKSWTLEEPKSVCSQCLQCKHFRKTSQKFDGSMCVSGTEPFLHCFWKASKVQGRSPSWMDSAGEGKRKDRTREKEPYLRE